MALTDVAGYNQLPQQLRGWLHDQLRDGNLTEGGLKNLLSGNVNFDEWVQSLGGPSAQVPQATSLLPPPSASVVEPVATKPTGNVQPRSTFQEFLDAKQQGVGGQFMSQPQFEHSIRFDPGFGTRNPPPATFDTTTAYTPPDDFQVRSRFTNRMALVSPEDQTFIQGLLDQFGGPNELALMREFVNADDIQGYVSGLRQASEGPSGDGTLPPPGGIGEPTGSGAGVWNPDTNQMEFTGPDGRKYDASGQLIQQTVTPLREVDAKHKEKEFTGSVQPWELPPYNGDREAWERDHRQWEIDQDEKRRNLNKIPPPVIASEITGPPIESGVVSGPIIEGTENIHAFQPVEPGGLAPPVDATGDPLQIGGDDPAGGTGPTATPYLTPTGVPTGTATTTVTPFGGTSAPPPVGKLALPPEAEVKDTGITTTAPPLTNTGTVQVTGQQSVFVDADGDGFDDNTGMPRDEFERRGRESQESEFDTPYDEQHRTMAVNNLFQNLSDPNNSPEQINAILQSILGLANLPSQKLFQEQIPGTLGSTQDLYDLGRENLVQPYDLPNVPNLDPSGFYEGGEPASEWNQYMMDQIDLTQIPIENLRDLTGGASKYMEGRTGDLVNPYRGDVDEMFRKERINLEESLSARNMLNSTQADEARRDLAGAHKRAMADADLKFYQGVGPERRADIGLVGNLLSQLYDQQMGGSRFALDKMGALGGAVGQGEAMDVQRRSGEMDRQQTNFTNLLQQMLTQENVGQNRMAQTMQPLSMLLSALAGVNVAPGTIGPLQMPMQRPPGPGAGELFGNLLGSLIGAGGQIGAGYMMRP